MRKLGLILTIMLITVIGLAGCASSSGAGTTVKAKEALPPPPPGTERLMLENGAYAIFKFELPAGTKWSDYNKITAEYLVDEANLGKIIKAVRLMGNYEEEDIQLSGDFRNANLSSYNGPYIMENVTKTWASMGVVANEWFTVTYDISGTKGHDQFEKENIPAPNAKGPFFFGLGISGLDSGKYGGITQLIRNVTLYHKTNPALNVVSKGSGFDEPTFASYFPVLSKREVGK